MRVNILRRENGPERLVADAEIVFGEGTPLAGMKLVGVSVWRGPDGGLYVTFPSRAFGSMTERKHYDFLRLAEDGRMEDAQRVKAWVLEEATRFLSTTTQTTEEASGASRLP